MNEEDVYAELSEIFRDTLDDPAIQIGAATTANDIPEWDSFNHINLVVGIELKFNVKFSSYEVERLENVGDMVNLIMSKLAK